VDDLRDRETQAQQVSPVPSGAVPDRLVRERRIGVLPPERLGDLAENIGRPCSASSEKARRPTPIFVSLPRMLR
jgi:hypothetical protein